MEYGAKEARDNFSKILSITEYRKERVLISRNGRVVGAIVPLEDLELLERLEDETDLKFAKEALKEADEKGTISLDALRKELEL